MKTSKMTTMLVLGLGLYANASPIEDLGPRGGVIEGVVSLSTDSSSSIFVNNVRVFLNSDTVIKSVSGNPKPIELRAGMMVRAEGYLVRGGLMARTIYVIER